MKAGLLSASLALLQLTAAAPLDKRAVVDAQVYQEYQVYVRPDGQPFSTAVRMVTEDGAAPTPAPAPVVPAPAPAVPAPGSDKPAPQPVPFPVAAPPQESKPNPAPAPVPKPNTGSSPGTQGPGFDKGISYSPYRSDHGIRSAEEISQDLASIRDNYDVVRVYGVDNDQVSMVLSALQGSKTQLFAGIFNIADAAKEAQSLISQVGGNWAQINTVSVGNELVNSGAASVEQVTSAVNSVRAILRGAGYTGPVVTVDTAVAIRANIALCQASDYCAVNCHAFFDGQVLAENAGPFVRKFVDEIASLAGGSKQVVVTESGWPSSGVANNVAVPSPENQKAAIASLEAEFDKDLILYSAFDQKWMQNNIKTFNAEQHWGILGENPSAV